ncbi:MAG TPA: GvpL/GvpF family gas vesicle protein [Pyrinomonadaceae bacterium]|jgi:hypothetical protein
MSKRASRKSPVRSKERERASFDAEAENDSKVFYVYCIGGRAALVPLFEGELPLSIEDESTLEAVGGSSLAAIVSAVAAADYGERMLEAHLSDARWTAARVMRHEQVVEFFAARTSVVPLRFGTIYLSRERVEQMLAEREDELRRILARIDGREEWGVNIYYDRETLKEKIPTVSPRLRELTEQAARTSPGQAYLMRKKLDALRADEMRAELKRVGESVERRLTESAEGAARLRVLKGEAAEHGEVAAKLAFLVARESFEEFQDAASRLADEYVPLGFRIELTGPWPAYNFTSNEG